jgi:cysteine synthase A
METNKSVIFFEMINRIVLFLLDGKVNAVVMSTGTGGTLAGISMFLKEKNSKIRTVLADPPVRIINFNI